MPGTEMLAANKVNSLLTHDRVTVGETSQDPDFYTNHDIITSPGQRATQQNMYSNTLADNAQEASKQV